jgi:hypothetical protein
MVTGRLLDAPGAPSGIIVPIEPADASAVCTMILECFVVLFNPEHMLDPQIPPDVAAFEDTPNTDRGSEVASTLLELLSSLGVNVPLAHRVLRLLAGNVSGRTSLRRAVAALHAKATRGVDSGSSNPTEVIAAAQWVATRYWGLSQQAQHADSEASGTSNSETFADVSNIMKEICWTMEPDLIVAEQMQQQSAGGKKAKERFAAATKASLAAAVAAGVDISAAEQRWERNIPDPISVNPSINAHTSEKTNTAAAAAAMAAAAEAGDLAIASGVFDPVTRMFWTNYRARAVQPTLASAALVMTKYIRETCLRDEYFTVADTLHLPLTRPLRPIREDMEAGQEADDEDYDGTDVAVEMEEEEEEGIGAGGQQLGGNEEVKKEEVEELPVLPPVAVVAPIIPPSSVPVIAPSSAPAADFDLYADLGGDLGGVVAPAPAAAVVPKAEPISEPTSPLSESFTPEAIAALLKDPAKMQEMIQRNPALAAVLKSKLGGSGNVKKK